MRNMISPDHQAHGRWEFNWREKGIRGRCHHSTRSIQHSRGSVSSREFPDSYGSRYNVPPFMTSLTCRKALMFWVGSPSTAARLPQDPA